MSGEKCRATASRVEKMALEPRPGALLLEATGGRMYYEELWDEAMDHVHDLVNHSPEAGDKTPAEKAGGHVRVMKGHASALEK